MWRVALFGSLLMVACTEKDDDDEDDDDGGGDDTAASDDSGGVIDSGGDIVEMVTSAGTIVIDLDTEAAPATTDNFLSYVEAGFYDGTDGAGATIFHRVIDGFVVQGGGFTAEGAQKSTRAAIALESDNGRSNVRGTIAMARTNVPDSATSQFYFNLVDNSFLDYTDASNPGYAVFGTITEGLDVMDAIAATPTDSGDVPLEAITIESVTVR